MTKVWIQIVREDYNCFVHSVLPSWMASPEAHWEVRGIVVSREVGRLKRKSHRGITKKVQICWKEQKRGQPTSFPRKYIEWDWVYANSKMYFFSYEKVNSAILCFTVLYSFYLSGNPDEIDSQNPPLSHFCTLFVGWWNDWVLELGFFSSTFHLLFSWIHFLFIKEYLLKNIYLF